MTIGAVQHGVQHRLLSDHRYAVVAASDLERLPSECESHSTAAGVLQDSDELLPRLVDLNQLTPECVSDLLRACLNPVDDSQGPPLSVLLKSDAEPHTLAAHFGRAQLGQSVSGERAWLRLHDPRVWLQLNRTLGAEKISSLMGPIDRWTYFWCGQWLTQGNSGNRSILGRYDNLTWAALERIGVVNRVLSRIPLHAESIDDVMRISKRVDEFAERAAATHRITRLEDLVEFCLLGLQVHARFDEHPKVHEFLLQVAADSSVFDELLSQDQVFWQSVGQTLNMTGEVRNER